MPEYYRLLTTLDIGIAPLGRTPFNRSKSWIKALDYMAAGVVPVVEDWGQYPELLGWSNRSGVVIGAPASEFWQVGLTAAIADLRNGAFDYAAIAARAREFEIGRQILSWADVYRQA